MASASDNRDKRDPEKLGIVLMGMRNTRGDCPTLASAADVLNRVGLTIDDYADTPVDHSAARLAELQKRAGKGDKFAIALLNGESLAEEPVD